MGKQAMVVAPVALVVSFVFLSVLINFPIPVLASRLPESTISDNNKAGTATADTDTCAVLHRKAPAAGNGSSSSIIRIRADQYVSDIEESFQSAKDGEGVTWIPISSFSVTSGCSLTACNSTDFDGLCKTFDVVDVALQTDVPAGFDDIRSASCTCAKDCKCSDAYIRRTGCARAYLNQGCNTCNSYYTDLKGRKESVTPEFRNNVSSVMVRPGCTLTVYDDESYEGDSIDTLEGVTKEVWTGGSITSYECTCAVADPGTIIPKPRPEHGPQQIEIPKTVDEISKLTSVHGRHAGLMAALKSYKNKRSPRNAYILVLGLTGAGKSSAINLLFDNENLTSVGDGISITNVIHEFRVPITVDELGITNGELRVVDTPGLGDTAGLEKDSRFLATLDEYLAGHEDLSHRLPNVVLVFGKFHDNRYCGKAAPFVKMLSALELFRNRLTDKKYSNVIFVLSHYMSMTHDVTRRPNDRIKSFKKCIEEYSLFPKPISIVVAENKAEAQGLPMLNGYFRLPNGEFYPRNLFDKIQQMLTNAEDPIGETIIRNAFRDSDGFNITAKHYELVKPDHGKAIRYMQELLGTVIPMNKTDVSEALAQAYNGMSDDLKRAYPDALHYIQKAFDLRNIRHLTDIPKTTLEIVQLLKSVKQNEANSFLMNAAFGLRAPTLKESVITGYSYNVLEDRPLTTSPFKLGELKISDVGYMFPNVMSCEVQHETLGILRTFRSREKYIEDRLRSLGIESGAVPAEQFTGTVRPGYNIYSVEALSNSSAEIMLTAVREHRTFLLTLNDRLDLTPEFIQTVRSLREFNASDSENVETWKSFFIKYGTHVVKSTHGGGSIEIQLSTRENLGLGPKHLAEAMFHLIQFAEDVSTGQVRRNSTNSTNLMSAGAGSNVPKHTLKFKGGDMRYHATELTSMSLGVAADLLENWKESIGLSPSILLSDMKLLPISQVAKKVGQNYSSEIQRAARLLFNSSLTYVRPSRPPGPGPDRQGTTQIPGSTNDYAMFLKVMAETQRNADERFQQIILQMQEEAKAAQLRREEIAAEERRWQREVEARREEDRRQMIESEKNRQLEWDKHRADQEARQREFNLQMMKAQQEEARRHAELMAQIAANANSGGGGSCLRAGSRILMLSGFERPVESLRVGDWIMDGDLNPTQVLGISKEFLMNQRFHGFSSGEGDDSQGKEHLAFFTNTHLFVSTNSTLYTADRPLLYFINPLLEYLDVQEMKPREEFSVQKVVRSPETDDFEVVVKSVQVFAESRAETPPADTLVYFLQVSNPAGTYFANGYMARHEIPPLHFWPNTMAVLFTAFQDSLEALRPVAAMPYTLESVGNIRAIVNRVDEAVRAVIEQNCGNFSLSSDANGKVAAVSVKSLEELDIGTLINEIYNNPSHASFGMGLYGTSGPFLAQYMDRPGGGCKYDDLPKVKAQLVHAIMDTIKSSTS